MVERRRRDIVNEGGRTVLLVVLLNNRHVDDTVAHLVVVAVLSCAVIAVAYTVAAIQVTDICLALGGMYTSPVGLIIVAVGIGRVVFLNSRYQVVFTRTGGEQRGLQDERCCTQQLHRHSYYRVCPSYVVMLAHNT